MRAYFLTIFLGLYCERWISIIMDEPTSEDAPVKYRLKEHRPGFGVNIYGLDLRKPLSPETLRNIRNDLHKHRLLIVKNPGALDGEDQIRVSEYFGEIDTLGILDHPKSPDYKILRVSNDDYEGHRNFGLTGFHVDGSFMEMPNDISIYHIISAPKKGETLFVPLREILAGLSSKKKNRWMQLWLFKKFERIRGSNEPGCVVHPLIYDHPVTGEQTMVFHLGKTVRFIWNYGSPNETKCSKAENEKIVKEINDEIQRNNGSLVYGHTWEDGDFIISDNRAIAHQAAPSTQLPREQIGLRVMHRTIIKGTTFPSRWRQVNHEKRLSRQCALI